ncbi:60s ribosomal protein l37, mitochondrial precursor [Papiliotrema laurentii]|uniref:Large ribosomal subunit protein mL54 n=1 Tax=Papiliotrema laurentii TaxID=5418 RepID=A0AAD9CT06_PAPLA|nr:60s ribosomal protein l37, mitochondrial precursor [Papiliotrema laurentii]
MSFSCALIRPALRQTSRIARTTCIGRAGFASSSRVAEESTLSKKQTISSCAPGTVLHGLNVLKDSSDPVAKPDEEYPAWLWNLIPTGKNSDLAEQPKQVVKKGETFDYAAEKRRLKAINKAKIKAANFLRGA